MRIHLGGSLRHKNLVKKLTILIFKLTKKENNMSTLITDECINCGVCEPECPNGAISEGEDFYEIDADLCTECVGFHGEEACQEVCPVDCCIPNEDDKETEEVLLEKAKKIHTDQEFPALADLTAETSLFHNPNRKNASL